METNRLRQFKSVVDAGGLLKASELLHISAGGLSKSIKVLEVELGYALFKPDGRGLQLTSAGRKLYERVPQVLQALEELTALSPRSSPASAAAVLRIVSFEVFTTYFLAHAARHQLAGYTLDVREALPGRMEALIAAGHADVGVTYLPVPTAGLEFTKVGRLEMGIFAAAKARKDLQFAAPIAPLEGSPSGVQGLDGWPEHLHPRVVAFRVHMMETAVQLARQGLACAFLPKFVVDLINEGARAEFHLHEQALPKGMATVHRDVFLIQRRESEETKVIRAIAKALRALL